MSQGAVPPPPPPPQTHTRTSHFHPFPKKKMNDFYDLYLDSTSLKMSLLSYCHPILPTDNFHTFDSNDHNFVNLYVELQFFSILCTLPCNSLHLLQVS